ncbi:MAG: AI-2E family transporter [Polymorphobacter sp.]
MEPHNKHQFEDRVFLALIAVVSVGLAVVSAPFFGAILWAIIATIVFFPMRNRLLRALPARRNSVALLTLLIIILAVILPALLLGVFLVDEASDFYISVQAGEIDFDRYFDTAVAQVPPWASHYLEPVGLTNLDAALARVGAALANSVELIAAQALNIGQSAFGFLLALGVMLYLTFFLLRDGPELVKRIGNAVPLRPEQRDAVLGTFALVIRATIKGSLVVAVLQGLIGGLIFWALGIHAPLLWAVVMTILAFLPVVGTGLVWLPVALYLLATGAIWQGVALLFAGIFVIGLVDNVVRPILVGRDTRLPDYLVLISTLGGLAVFGANGIVVGPVIAALFLTVWEIFATERQRVQR